MVLHAACLKQTIDGGTGFDYITTDSGGDNISFSGSLSGTITITFSQTDFIDGNPVTTTKDVGSLVTTGIEGIEGRGGNDSITGDGNKNTLNGGAANDTIGDSHLWIRTLRSGRIVPISRSTNGWDHGT